MVLHAAGAVLVVIVGGVAAAELGSMNVVAVAEEEVGASSGVGMVRGKDRSVTVL